MPSTAAVSAHGDAAAFRRTEANWPVLVICLACGFTTLLLCAGLLLAAAGLSLRAGRGGAGQNSV